MSTAASPFNPIPTLSFRLKGSPPSSKFLPRLGQVTLTRPNHGAQGGAINIELLTPGLMTSTNRGVIQHLSRDNVKRTACVNWVHVPFESFLQIEPPIPTQQKTKYPLHTFLGFSPSEHVLSLSLRDAADGRETPPNGKLFLAAQSSRGTRKVTCPAYRSYVTTTLPDIVFAMSDVPFNSLPHSQKRISKSIERSAQWLSTILVPLSLPSTAEVQDLQKNTSNLQNNSPSSIPRLNVFVHMVGGMKPAARSAFAAALLEPLESKEKDLLQLETLDEGVSGYVFDLVPLRMAFGEEPAENMAFNRSHLSSLADSFAPLIRASLQDLPDTKLRLVNTVRSPHEMLKLIRDAGVDLFDTYWAQQAASWGVALDFCFPVPVAQDQQQAVTGRIEMRQIGHNLYEERFAHEFTSLADSFVSELEFSKRGHESSVPSHIGGSLAEIRVCSCAACSPTWSNHPLVHSTVDDVGRATIEPASPYTRAYVHHLLHTHEMSAHALLVMHNLTVMNAFMSGVRDVLEREQGDLSLNGIGSHANRVKADGILLNEDNPSSFAVEVARFEQTYDIRLQVLDEAKVSWAEVDFARGKGRLARERERAKPFGDVSDTTTAENKK